MKLGLAVLADFDGGLLGGAACLDTLIADGSPLTHTLCRAARINDVTDRILFCKPADATRAEDALRQANAAHAGFRVVADNTAPRPRRELLTAARRLHPHAWRGAPLGATWFDEFLEPLALPSLFAATDCDALLCLDGHQPLLDVNIAANMLAHYRENRDEAPFVFTQAPPGLAGLLISRGLVQAMLDAGAPFGQLFAYRPDSAEMDLLTKPMCLLIDPLIAQTPGRWTGDTRRSREMIKAAWEEMGQDVAARELCAWARQAAPRDPLPIEIELELTTQTSLPRSSLTGSAFVGEATRSLKDLDALERISAELAGEGDRRVVLSGHGDPLLYPDLSSVFGRLRGAGVTSIALVTHLVDLNDGLVELLFSTPVDLVQVRLDAHSPAVYETVHGEDRFTAVTENIERLLAERRRRSAPRPIIAPSLTRCTATLAEMEPFFEHWTRRCGWALIEGWSDYAGRRRPPDPLIHMAPPVRGPCRRLASRLMLLADGRAAACDQDPAGGFELGRWDRQSLREIWSGAERAALLESHERGEWSGRKPCETCREWFRW